MSDVIYVHSSIYVECSLDSAKANLDEAVKKVVALLDKSSFEYTQNGEYHELYSENTLDLIKDANCVLENAHLKLNAYAKILKTGPDELTEIDHECKNNLTTWTERLSYYADSFKEDIKNSGGIGSWLFSGAVAVSSYINTKIDDSGSVFKFISDTWENLKSPADGWIENHPVIGYIVEQGFKKTPIGKAVAKVDQLSGVLDREELQEGNDTMDFWNAKAEEAKSKGKYKQAVEYAGLGALSGFAGLLNAVGAEAYELLVPEDAREMIAYYDNYKAQAGADFKNGDYLETAKDLGKAYGLGLMVIARVTTQYAAEAYIGMTVGYYCGVYAEGASKAAIAAAEKAAKIPTAIATAVYKGLTKGCQWLTGKFFEY